MKIILLALAISFFLEFITIYARMIWHRRSDKIQKRLHLPRVHHSYPGFAILLFDYVYLNNEWLFIIGFALVFSDMFHHLIFEPFVRKHGFDVGQARHNIAHHYIASLPAAVALIMVGIFALVTPFTPGSWLSVIGVGMILGKNPDHLWRKVRQKLHSK